MDTTIAILEALKAKTGATSDYQLAKVLGVSRAVLSTYRVGRSSFNDETAIKVASILDVEPGLILAIIYAERAKTPELKAVWRSAFEKLGGIAAAVTMGIMLNAFSPTPANASTGSSDISIRHNQGDLYIMRS